MSDVSIIDTKMHGRDGITAAFVVQGERVALVETGPKSRVETVLDGLQRLGIDHLDWIVVTHIHLDHAGAAGTIAARFPHATVAVHEVGAPHLADPAKLWSSAARIYGDRMEALWGGIDPVPSDRIRSLVDGDVIDLGGRKLRAVDTPGHAYHHHAYLDETAGVLFSGDALGVRLPEIGALRPATPPPEFHLEKAIASIERIARLEPRRLFLTHFGPHDHGNDVTSVEGTCRRAIEALRRWEEWVRASRGDAADLDGIAELVKERARADAEGSLDAAAVDRLEQTTSYRMNASGYLRYFDKLAADRPS